MAAKNRFSPKTLAEEVASYVRKALLLSDTYPPGTFIREEELASKLGISRAPIREGLKILEGLGLIQSIPQKGSIVVTFSPDEIEELYEIRFALEEIVFREIIKRGSFNHKKYEYLEKLLDRMLLLANTIDTHKEFLLDFSAIDLEFHLYLAESSGRHLTIKMLKTTYRQIQQAIIKDIATENDIKQLVADHHKILDSLMTGDLKSLQKNRFFSYFHRRITSSLVTTDSAKKGGDSEL